MKRRDFLKTSVAVPALAGLSSATLTAAAAAGGASREFYELRTYRLKPPGDHALLDTYLQKVAIPTLNRLGSKPVGVFTEMEPKGSPALFVLIPYPSIESYISITARFNADLAQQQAAQEYLQAPKANPAFERIDSWLMLAFAGMPRLGQPPYSKDKKPRIFELRTYESHTELKALKKVDMFNAGEIEVMQQVGLGPIFFGQALLGGNLPHLTYMLSGTDKDSHKQHFGAFAKHPIWLKLKNDPQYADTVSKITSRFLSPTGYSQL